MPTRSKPSLKWTKQRLLEYIAELELGSNGTPSEPVEHFDSKQAIVHELYRLYNEKDVPWAKRMEILKMIAMEQHGMFVDKKKGGSAIDDFLKFFAGLSNAQLEEAEKG